MKYKSKDTFSKTIDNGNQSQDEGRGRTPRRDAWTSRG